MAGRRIRPFRIEAEALKLSATSYITDGPFRGVAIRDGRSITGRQRNFGAAAARLSVEALGR